MVMVDPRLFDAEKAALGTRPTGEATHIELNSYLLNRTATYESTGHLDEDFFIYF